jgi:prepilin-type N-terminal cleavage/methylation domain-containing protein
MRLRSPSRGFTIIEMLVVLVVLGILAGLGFAKLQSSKDKATIAGMHSDLRAVAEEQEAFYFDHRFYSPTTDSLNPNYTGGNLVVVHQATTSGWSGSVSNPKVTRVCYVVVGNAAPVGTATSDGVISCS